MAIIYDFQKTRDQKFNQGPYVAPPLIESLPQDIQDTIENKNAADRRRLIKIAASLIKSADIPKGRDITLHDRLPQFDYPPTNEK